MYRRMRPRTYFSERVRVPVPACIMRVGMCAHVRVWVRVRTYTRVTRIYTCRGARAGAHMGTSARSLKSVRDAQVRALCAWAGTGTGTRAEGYVFFL